MSGKFGALKAQSVCVPCVSSDQTRRGESRLHVRRAAMSRRRRSHASLLDSAKPRRIISEVAEDETRTSNHSAPHKGRVPCLGPLSAQSNDLPHARCQCDNRFC